MLGGLSFIINSPAAGLRPPLSLPPQRPQQLTFAAILRTTVLLLLVAVLALSPAVGQRRNSKPTLRLPSRDYFAGRLLLIPLDGRPASWQLPRQVARIADHEIIVPPRSLLGNVRRGVDRERVVNWVRSQNYAEVNGVIIALDALGGTLAAGDSAETIKQRLSLIEWLRSQCPQAPIYGFTSQIYGTGGESSGGAALPQLVLDLVSKGLLDHLLIQPSDAARDALQGEVEARKLGDRVSLAPPATEATTALVARYINASYKRPLKVLPIYPAAAETAGIISRAIDAQIAAIGGVRLAVGATEQALLLAAARQADVLLFVYPTNADAATAQSLIDDITRAVSAGYYVAIADLSAGDDETLMKELRRRKMLDLLVAYAASPQTAEGLESGAARAVGLVLAQSAARIIGAKFLRDDIDRLHRIERAQVELLFTRYVVDWGYAKKVRPQLEAHVRDVLKADPHELGAAAERAEEFARGELTTLAEGLFAEQFRRNIHSVLFVETGRVEFMLHSLQRFQFRLPWARTDVPEVVPRVYVVLYSMPPSLINK